MVPAKMAGTPRAEELRLDEEGERAAPTAAAIEMLREAEILQQDGVGYRDILEVCLMDGYQTESDLPLASTDSAWIPVRAQHGLCLCLPAKGVGSLEHAFETLCWLATGQVPLPEADWDCETMKVPTSVGHPKTVPLWEAMRAMEVALAGG